MLLECAVSREGVDAECSERYARSGKVELVGSETRVVPSDLVSSAEKIVECGSSLASAHAASVAELSGAAPQCVGTSGAALAILAADWGKQAAAISERLSIQASAFHGTAQGYTTVDDANAAQFRSPRG